MQFVKEPLENRRKMWFEHLVRMVEERQIKAMWEVRAIGKNVTENPRLKEEPSSELIFNRRKENWNTVKQNRRYRKMWRNFIK